MQARKVIVTGASSGIGLATARSLLNAGHTIIGIARRRATIAHPQFSALSIDLSSRAAAARLDTCCRQNTDISAVISIAGGGHFGSLENFSCRQIEQSIAQNLVSHLLVARCFLPALKRQAGGKLIFLGSEAALSGARQGSLYCAAKFGLRGFAQSLRAECAGNGLHVGIINPGMVRSAFFDSQAFAPGDDPDHALTPDDVSTAIGLMLNTPHNAVVDELTITPLKRVVVKKPPLPPDSPAGNP